MPITLSPNMSLPVPVVGAEPGPQYATDVNNSLNIIDGHNHTPGYGVPIPASAINFNADISAMNNRLTLAKSITFTVQGSPLASVLPDIGAVYVSGVDLYYNDINGNQVRLTQNGSVNSGNGSISGLTAPASASYSSGTSTFIWQSNVNTAAAMDNGPVTIREIAANAKGVTIQSPVALPADYSLTFPAALPGGTSFLTVDASGNIQDNIPYPLPPSSQASVNIVISSSSGSFSTSSLSPVNITNLSCTITTSGRPVSLGVQSDGSGGASYFQLDNGATVVASMSIALSRGATQISDQIFFNNTISGAIHAIPGSSVNHIDTPSAGTYTYTVQLFVSTNIADATANNLVLVAREL